MYNFQSGYKPSYSTQTAVIKITDDIRAAMDKRQITIIILLGFSRAFDTINHDLLLSMLKFYFFSDEVVQWFGSYLKDRYQRVRTFSGSFSEWKLNPVGVPQGSTLSAMLFFIFINRISEPIFTLQNHVIC
jgi:hypothetical protein